MPVNVAASNAGLRSGDLAFGDMDLDGDLDVVASGFDSTNRQIRAYRNNGNGTFTGVGQFGTGGLTPAAFALAWGDYDNDGDLDILLAGVLGSWPNPEIPTTKVYRNDGGTFADSGAVLTGIGYGSVAWGDYDNDGDVDILLAGEGSGSNRVAKVYRNDGGSSFVDTGTALVGVQGGSIDWGDCDSDGDPDLLAR